ncbi:hypothetical protein FHS90_001138 [Rufibacter quisquiliarum]|uniref:Uncharacterized protein n=1 Tax=Rufibacter quisquiliarum TaxID=1549639 RepID=A0A839GA92_9BACT|nr:hypothetical protein [Rufibacter quisquiliarum]
MALLERRNAVIKEVAESDKWKAILGDIIHDFYGRSHLGSSVSSLF